MSTKIENVSLSVNGNPLVAIPEWNIEKGKMYGLCGDTGSGKSTIGKWLANVEPRYWEVTWNGNPWTRTTLFSLSDSSYPDVLNSSPPLYLLQDAYRIFNPYLSILTHFEDIWKNQMLHSTFENFENIFTILEEVGISDPRSLMARKVHQISQGEAQRMAFVLGLIRPASLRIYDEVFSNVDAEACQAMLTYLGKYCTRTKTTVIIISHDTDMITEYTDVVYQIYAEKLKRIPPTPDRSIDNKITKDYPLLMEFKEMSVPAFPTNRRASGILCRLPEFSIGRSENIGLYGESGIGKTTFLRGLISENPLFWKEFNISVPGDENSTTSLADLDIRYLPQSVVSAFNPSYPLKTSISEIIVVHKIEEKELSRLIRGFGLNPHYLEKYPDELSGGEIQRIGIISVLLGQPDLILLDESFSSVDQGTREAIWSVLIEEQRIKSFSLLVVSHDVSWLRKKMNRIYEITS